MQRSIKTNGHRFSDFLEVLHCFIHLTNATICVYIDILLIVHSFQSNLEKNQNRLFWNDTHAFWNRLIDVCRAMQDLVPSSSCEKTLGVLKALKLNLPAIEESHGVAVPDPVKRDVEHLHDAAQRSREETEAKRLKRDVAAAPPATASPPNDFREIDVYPNVGEITSPERPFLRPNVVRGPYRDVEHYLDVQFRLLREDFVAPLRRAVCAYLRDAGARLEDVRVYDPVRFLRDETVNEQICFRVAFESGECRR